MAKKYTYTIQVDSGTGRLSFCATGRSNGLGAYVDMVSLKKIN